IHDPRRCGRRAGRRGAGGEPMSKPAGAQERPQAAERAAAHVPHAPGVSQAATGPLNASPPKENPMARHTPDKPQDVVTALRDDLTHALGSGHLADLALRAVEPALLAVEVDTAQRMQDDVDHWRARAEAAERRADEHERQLREQIARDIEETADADVIGPYEAGLDRAARVARGERLPGAPAPTLDDLARRAAGIALPSEPADILAALLRIGGDLARAYKPGRADMERELGNLVVSSLRWMARRGLDPRRGIETAGRARRAHAERKETRGASCPHPSPARSASRATTAASAASTTPRDPAPGAPTAKSGATPASCAGAASCLCSASAPSRPRPPCSGCGRPSRSSAPVPSNPK